MSTEEDAGNDRHDDAEAQTDDGADEELLSWDQTQAEFANRRNETSELFVQLEQGAARFVVRGLDEDEQAEVEDEAVSFDQGRRGQGGGVSIDSKAMKNLYLKHGVVEGPAGFKPNREDHLSQIPPGVKDELADEIEALSSLDVVDRESFQEVGEGE